MLVFHEVSMRLLKEKDPKVWLKTLHFLFWNLAEMLLSTLYNWYTWDFIHIMLIAIPHAPFSSYPQLFYLPGYFPGISISFSYCLPPAFHENCTKHPVSKETTNDWEQSTEMSTENNLWLHTRTDTICLLISYKMYGRQQYPQRFYFNGREN